MEPAEGISKIGIINKESLRDGLYLGLVNAVISFIGWLSDPLFFIRVNVAAILLAVLFIVVQCYFLQDIRKKVGNYWSFGEVLRASIFIFLASGIVYAIWSYILYNMIDHSLGPKVTKATIEKAIEMWKQSGESKGFITEQMEKLKTRDTDPGSPANILQGFFQNVGFWVVISLVLAFIFKKEKPVFVSGS